MQAVSSYGVRNEGLFDRVVVGSSLVQKLVAAVQQWSARRALEVELYGLSDRDLDDMGISRRDIPAVAKGEFVPRRIG